MKLDWSVLFRVDKHLILKLVVSRSVDRFRRIIKRFQMFSSQWSCSMIAAAVPTAHVAGSCRGVDSSIRFPSGQLQYKTHGPNASGCLATQASRVQPGCSSTFPRGEKRTDVGWLSKQRLGSNALAESSSSVARHGGRVANVRSVMVPVRPTEPSLKDSGNGASMRATEIVSSRGISGVVEDNARGSGTMVQSAAQDTDAAEARASLRAAGVYGYDPIILSRRFARQPFKVSILYTEKCRTLLISAVSDM